jgi:methionyl aminopeptidase
VVRAYCGHGIGDLFHCAPDVLHYAKNKAKGTMKVGEVFTIEPMINQGTHREKIWPDGWTSVTEDGRRSAQFEHTLVITPDGCEVLTARLPSSPPLWWEAEAETEGPAQEQQENGHQQPQNGQ